MSDVSLHSCRHGSADKAAQNSIAPLSTLSPNAVDLPSIEEMMMVGGYNISNLSWSDSAPDEYIGKDRSRDGTQGGKQQHPLKQPAVEDASTTKPSPIASPPAVTQPVTTTSTSGASTSTMANGVAPARKDATPSSSLTGSSLTPSNPRVGSTRAKLASTPHADTQRDALDSLRLSNYSNMAEEAKRVVSAAPLPPSVISPKSQPTKHLPATTVTSPPKLAAPVDSSSHSTSLPRLHAPDSRDASLSGSASATSQSASHPRSLHTPEIGTAPNWRHPRVIITPQSSVATLPLTPPNNNLCPMQRVSVVQRTSPTPSPVAAGRSATSAMKPLAPVQLSPPQASMSVFAKAHSTMALHATMPVNPTTSPAARESKTATSTTATKPPPAHPATLSGSYTCPLATAALPLAHSPSKSLPLPSFAPKPPGGRSSSSSTALARTVSHPHSSTTANEAGKWEPSPTPLNDGSEPNSDGVPQWLAKLNVVLVQHPSTASAPENCSHQQTSVNLIKHRTFSHSITSLKDVWLNPCTRPQDQQSNSTVVAAQDSQGAQEGTDDSQSSLIRKHFSASHNPPILNSSSHSNTALPSASNNTASFASDHWQAEGGAPVRHQYPSYHTSLTGSISSADNIGFIPVSREQRIMSPQSQRWDSSGGLSLRSSVGGSDLLGQSYVTAVMAPHIPGAAPLTLRRGCESPSAAPHSGSEKYIAPVHLIPTSTGKTAASRIDMKQEPSVMPLEHRHQPRQSPRDDVSLDMRTGAGLQCCAASPASAPSFASELSMNDGPSSMRLPLARFMRNSSNVSSGNVREHCHAQQQHSNAYTLRVASPPAILQQPVHHCTQQQQGAPTVMSLQPKSPRPQNPLDNTHSISGSRRAPARNQSPHQEQAVTLRENDDSAASLSVIPTDATSNVSRATSGISLTAETIFLRCD
ncbi:hypothetical protein ABL78_2512 [Leptomonas seymouri]|uniref:Uncharacterized protein n=1 Tax=Leptomonas seymouri TaxID=5684 RepID=A0A0N1PCE5_LEPSE|nr:hypothetical protein ABL78_2512 [Leptomonas seymouri]|eukprot:KPI88393.1 hypothetical protein ABL78_2512 [Leptomonas seymouri]